MTVREDPSDEQHFTALASVRPERSRIARVAAELPPEALAVVESHASPVGASAYRAPDLGHGASVRWYPVVVRPPPSGADALVWPVVRTAVPASISVALVGTLVSAAAALGTLGAVGVALGSVVTALIARTQYTLERDDHAVAAVWLASDGSRLLVARFPNLTARLARRARYELLPIEALAPASEPSPATGPWAWWRARQRRIAYALGALRIDGATVDLGEAERVHTLARLARRRRRREGR